MDVVRLSNFSAAAVIAAVALLSSTHLGRAQASAPATAPFVSAAELARRLDQRSRPATPSPVFSLSGSVLPPAPGTGPAMYGTLPFSPPRFRPAPTSGFDALIDEASRRFDIPPAWVRGVMRIESGGRTMLDGRPITSPAGAMGLMQVMPATFAELSHRNGLGSDPYEPRANILAGAAYLREMYDRFGPAHFLAAYNAGPRRVDEHLRTGRALPGETRRYVQTLAPALGDDVGLGVSGAPSTVRDLTSLDALRAAALPSFRPARDQPGARRIASIFVPRSAASSTVVLRSEPQPDDELFVRLTRADQHDGDGGRDGTEE